MQGMLSSLYKKLKYYLIFASFPLVFAASDQKFILIHTIKDAAQFFDQAGPDTLVIFDIDNTITTPSDPYLQIQAIMRNQHIYDNLTKLLTPDQLCIFNHLWCTDSESILVEKEYPEIIQKLHDKGAKVIGFTAAKTGPVGLHIKDFPEWRYQDVKRFGIDFSKTFPDTIIFEELPDDCGHSPGFVKGIVYSGQKSSKGDVVRFVFIELKLALKWTPKIVIVIDDREGNLTSLKKAIHAIDKDIHFIGILYRGVDKLPPPQIDPVTFRQKYTTLTEKAKDIVANMRNFKKRKNI